MTLFDKYGGRGFWLDAVDIFYQRLVDDTQLGPFFREKDISRVKVMNSHLLECALGDRSAHLQLSVKLIHSHLTITAADLRHFAELFDAVLTDKGVDKSDLEAINEMVYSFYGDVVTK